MYERESVIYMFREIEKVIKIFENLVRGLGYDKIFINSIYYY